MTSLATWTEWRQRCALDLCSGPTQTALREFAVARFANYLITYAHRTNVPARDAARLAPPDPWHLFEAYFTVHESRAGKHYKDWLFARAHQAADPPLDLIQGGATLLLRDVVRDFLRWECSPARFDSLHESAPEYGEGVTLADLLPDGVPPTAEVERHEWETLAARHAAALLPVLDPRERLALIAKELDVPLGHPVLLQLAGCARSMLHLCWRRLYQRLARDLQDAYRGEDPSAILQLALLTLAETTRLAVAQARLELRCAPLFSIVEDNVVVPRATQGSAQAEPPSA